MTDWLFDEVYFDNNFVDWNAPSQITEYHGNRKTTDKIKEFIQSEINKNLADQSQEISDLKKRFENEHENFLSVHRDNMRILARNMELKKLLGVAREFTTLLDLGLTCSCVPENRRVDITYPALECGHCKANKFLSQLSATEEKS